MPDGHLAQAREFLCWNAALSPLAEGRKNQRWELAYVPAAGTWLEYVGTQYRAVAKEILSSRVLAHFEPYHRVVKAPAGRPVRLKDGTLLNVKRAAISYGNAESVTASMVGDCAVHADALPAWSPPTFDGAGKPLWGGGLRARSQVNPADVIPVKNGLLRIDALMDTSDDRHKGGRVVIEPHTPNFISTSCAAFDVNAEMLQQQIDSDHEDEEAGGSLVNKLCPHWLKFLGEVSGGCSTWTQELGKFFGLCLTNRVMDRAGLLVGEPRTGKGTIADVLIEVLGDGNVVTSRLNSLVGRHELHNFVGKSLLFFDELEVGHMTDTAEAVGRLKTIIAGTPVSADPKHKDAFTFRVLGKVLMTANKIPRLRDTSGALAGRLLVFPTQGESHVGKEDYGLKSRLKAEARGVLVWSLFHLRMLLRQGKFTQPPEGEKVIENFKRLGSPIYAFLKDCMVPHEHGGVAESLLRRLYSTWADDSGLGRMGQENFLADLMATVRGVRRETREQMGSAKKERVVMGVRPRLFGPGEARAKEIGTAEKPFIVWADEIDRLDHYGFDFPGDERKRSGGREVQYPPGGGSGQMEIPV